MDSDNGSEFINHHLLDWCSQREITFTRSRPGNTGSVPHFPDERTLSGAPPAAASAQGAFRRGRLGLVTESPAVNAIEAAIW